jgi:predicted lipid carrier protein YhbT
MLNTLLQKPLIASVNQQLVCIAPKLIKPIVHKIPVNWQAKFVLSILNQLFAEQIEDGELDFLHDHWLAIEINDLALTWLISFDGEKFIMWDQRKPAVSAHVKFSANSDDLMLIAARLQDPDTLFFQRKLEITGNTDLGLAIKNLIDSVDLDNLPASFHQVIKTIALLIHHSKSTH